MVGTDTTDTDATPQAKRCIKASRKGRAPARARRRIKGPSAQRKRG